jgi:F0F1-type ATP synthase assembly protein I
LNRNSQNGLRSYTIIVNSVFQLLTTIAMGYGIGWLIDRSNETVIYRAIGMVIFSIIGLINFIVQLNRYATGGKNAK